MELCLNKQLFKYAEYKKYKKVNRKEEIFHKQNQSSKRTWDKFRTADEYFSRQKESKPTSNQEVREALQYSIN